MNEFPSPETSEEVGREVCPPGQARSFWDGRETATRGITQPGQAPVYLKTSQQSRSQGSGHSVFSLVWVRRQPWPRAWSAGQTAGLERCGCPGCQPGPARKNWAVQEPGSTPSPAGGYVGRSHGPGSTGWASRCLFAPIKAPTSLSQSSRGQWGGVLPGHSSVVGPEAPWSTRVPGKRLASRWPSRCGCS